ncbi:unnamed protein product [Brassica rapa subsp. trilocularis]
MQRDVTGFDNVTISALGNCGLRETEGEKESELIVSSRQRRKVARSLFGSAASFVTTYTELVGSNVSKLETRQKGC